MSLAEVSVKFNDPPEIARRLPDGGLVVPIPRLPDESILNRSVDPVARPTVLAAGKNRPLVGVVELEGSKSGEVIPLVPSIVTAIYTTVQTEPEETVTVMPAATVIGPALEALSPEAIVWFSEIVAEFTKSPLPDLNVVDWNCPTDGVYSSLAFEV